MLIQSNAWEWDECLHYMGLIEPALHEIGYEVTDIDEATYTVTIEPTLDHVLEVMKAL